MKSKSFFNALAVMAASTLVLAACGGDKAEPVVVADAESAAVVVDAQAGLETIDQRISYIVGSNMGQQFKRDDIDLDVTALILAVEDTKADKEPRLSEDEIRDTITKLQTRAQEKQKAEQEAVTEKNKVAGAAFLVENAKKDGVVTTESGLQYKEVTAGDGAKPTADDTVTVHYKGTLIDGTEFDSSYTRGQPASFPVGGVIAGWVEALQLMNVGDKFELAIPSDLAYGPGGTGPVIGPHATLLFEVELLEIAKSDDDSAQPDTEQSDTVEKEAK